jgi:hypothetical protein
MSFLFRDPLGTNFGSDAFGRLRVSDTFTIGDYKHSYSIDPEFIDVKVGVGATLVFIPEKACVNLVAGTSSNGYCIHQTKRYHHYLPGKSQLIYSSFKFGAANTNVTKRTGYFDDKNGIFFEQTGNGVLSFVLRSSTTGIVSERRIPQSQWNKDRLDGEGPSGATIDITKTQLFVTDFEWLGVGKVRCGFAINGDSILAHEFDNANYQENVYMSTPVLPIRCEIRNTGTVSTAASFSQICATVMSEGGYVESGQEWSHTTPLRTISIGSTLPVIKLRLKNSFQGRENRATIKLVNITVFSVGGNVKFEVIKIPTSAGLTASGTWVSENDNSAAEFNQTATVLDNVYYEDFLGGYASGSSQNVNVVSGSSANSQLGPIAKKNFLAQNFDSTDSEVFSIRVSNIDTAYTANVGVSIQWKELY